MLFLLIILTKIIPILKREIWQYNFKNLYGAPFPEIYPKRMFMDIF